jgi:hypothetical protein
MALQRRQHYLMLAAHKVHRPKRHALVGKWQHLLVKQRLLRHSSTTAKPSD